jgi:hypothetical protein
MLFKHVDVFQLFCCCCLGLLPALLPLPGLLLLLWGWLSRAGKLWRRRASAELGFVMQPATCTRKSSSSSSSSSSRTCDCTHHKRILLPEAV